MIKAKLGIGIFTLILVGAALIGSASARRHHHRAREFKHGGKKC